MTLKEFCANDIRTVPFGRDGALLMFAADVPTGLRWALFHLEDWCVSSCVSGPGYVLVPREVRANA